jgi:hypothetical protein
LITNLGQNTAFFAVGGSGVTANPSSIPLLPGSNGFALTIGTNTYIAALALTGASPLNITVGT